MIVEAVIPEKKAISTENLIPSRKINIVQFVNIFANNDPICKRINLPITYNAGALLRNVHDLFAKKDNVVPLI